MRRSSLLPLALCAALLAGCGGGDGGSGSGADATSEPTASSELESLSAEEVLERAKAAFVAAGSVRLAGDIVEDGEQISLDLSISAGEGGRGTIAAEGTSFEIIRTGTDFYLNAPAEFYAAQGEPEVGQLLGGRFVKAPADDEQFADLVSFTDLQAIADEIFAPEGELEKTDVVEIDGQPAIGLRDDDGGVLYVAAEGEPLPLRIAAVEEGQTPAPDATSSGALDFTDYGKPVDLAAPADAVDLASLGG